MPEIAPANPMPHADNIPAWKCDDLNLETARALYPHWSDLALNAIEKNVFYFPWFVTPSLPLLEVKQPKIVTVYLGDLLIGLFIVHEDIGYAHLPIPFYRTALHLHQFLGTPLVRTGYSDQFAAGLCAWLDAAPKERSFLLLTQQTGDSEIFRAVAKICKTQNRQLIMLDQAKRAAITPCPNGNGAPENHISKNRRKSLNRKLKNLISVGDVSIEKLSCEEDFDNWIDSFLTLENAGWKGDQQTSILSSKKDIALYREMVFSALNDGHLNFFRMTLNGEPIAYTLDISCPPNTYCVKSCFDPSYKEYSPGILMEFETLKYYSQHAQFGMVDSCTDPENAILNELWPDRKRIVTLAIARKGLVYRFLFWSSNTLKEKLRPWVKAFSS